MHTLKALSTAVAAFLLCATVSYGADWYVSRYSPGPVHDGTTLRTAFYTIQEGIDAAANGDRVLVNRGLYFGAGNTNLSFNGKAITIESIKGAHNTIIDCMDQGYAFIFDSGEGADSILSGFTIFQAGNADGAIVIRNTSPTIAGNTIRKARTAAGAGIHCVQGSPVITRNTIRNCKGVDAGGIYLEQCSATVTSNILHHNTSDVGAGIRLVASTADIVNNTIAGNIAVVEGGGLHLDGSTAVVANTILWNNLGPAGPEASLIATSGASTMDVDYSDVMGGQQSVAVDSGSTLNWGLNNIDDDPLFVDPAEMDFHIIFDSPCRSAGDKRQPALPEYDFEMDPVISLFTFPEIGADEFNTHFYVRGTFALGETATGVIVGWPSTNPVVMITGTGIYRDPIVSLYGDFWLHGPWDYRIHLSPIPLNGVREVERTITSKLPPGTEIPIQVLVGTELTNLWIVIRE